MPVPTTLLRAGGPTALALLALAGLACTGLGGDGHLRGTVAPSPDGGTWLQFDDDNGGQACDRIHVDGAPWPHPIGTPGPIAPGVHTAECGGRLEFTVPEGMLFRFDYWGP